MHGYTTTESVIWNTKSTKAHSVNFLIRSRQHGNGYVIGTSGVVNNVVTTPVSGTVAGTTYAYDTSPADFVEGIGTGYLLIPQSLYADQLIKRKIRTSVTDIVSEKKIVSVYHVSSDLIAINLNHSHPCNRLLIYNTQGQLILARSIEPNEMKIDITTDTFSQGVYIIHFVGQKGKIYSYKFIKTM
jgi:hypothetical protein